MHRLLRGLILALLASVLTAAPALAAESGFFLQLGAGTRAAGMSDAYVAVADDATSVWWNPAGLGYMTGTEVSLSYGNLFGMNWNYGLAAVAMPLGKGNTLAVQGLGLLPGNTPGLWSGSAALAYGHKFGDNFSVGATVKGFFEEQAAGQAGGFGLDLGAQYRTPLIFTDKTEVDASEEVTETKIDWGTLSAGVMLRNVLATEYLADGTVERFPFKPVVGVAYQTPDKRLLLSADAEIRTTSGTVLFRGGAELRVTDYLVFRTGVHPLGYLSVGLGLDYHGFGLDYAYQMTAIGGSHFVTAGYTF